MPATNSQATGMAKFTEMGDSVEYCVNASNIQGVTAGHIHSGKQGENGPVVVTSFKYDSPMNQVAEKESITADKLEGPMVGKQLSDLATAMSNGETYVNVLLRKSQWRNPWSDNARNKCRIIKIINIGGNYISFILCSCCCKTVK